MKFGNLLKKEMRELLTFQTIFGMVFTLFLFVILGQVMGNGMEESMDTSTINICDQDNTEFSKSILKELGKDQTLTINKVDIQGDNYAAELAKSDAKSVIIIPQGFSDQVNNGDKAASLILVGKYSGGGMFSSLSGMSSADSVTNISKVISDSILKNKLSADQSQIDRINNPVELVEYTVVGEKMAKVSPSALSAITMTQSMIIPFVIFFLLLMASQMIMTAISTEKIDKTLETLLSTPVSRLTVLSAKMVAALIVALLNAGVMMVGFIFYITGMTGGALTEITESAGGTASAAADMANIGAAMSELGLTISVQSVLLIGLQMFVSIAIGLSLALILGAMATDVKSVQTLVMPLMMLTLIPFFATIYSDVNAMSTPIKVILYLIPFTHSYTAVTNLTMGHLGQFWLGFGYQIVVLIVCMFFAVRMFTTDLIFTMKFELKKNRKNATANQE